ncbi:11316_t:CDS:2 [Dentiscutata erythropus]|uniref:11316_t:CDS:1 n=1 Tax=Dentiscutata erythropus TaxID=1348616 RepID=A0A9N9EMV5_9GLOM|nr:11316_t:CDS:2 [Dentiscutata erythropus]
MDIDLDSCSIHCLITSLGSAEIKETEEEVEVAQVIIAVESEAGKKYITL